MKAIVQRRYGGPEVLALADAADPVAPEGWVVVELRAAALNWHDVLVRRGVYDSPLPHTPGADGAGVDLSTGEDVMVLPSWWWGDDAVAPGPDWEILGDHRPGTYAERVAVPRDCVVPRPAGLSWDQAAALPLVGLTAFRALFARGGLRAGESLLVLGAGGGVSTMAVSLAAAVGAEVVVTSSSEEKIAGAVSLGALGGVSYDHPAWPEAAREVNRGRGFDVVLDSVGTWSESVRALRPGGRLVVLGASGVDSATIEVRPFYFGQYSLLGTTMGSPDDMRGLLDLLDRHAVAPPVIDSTFALGDAVAAHIRLESGSVFGKVVLSP